MPGSAMGRILGITLWCTWLMSDWAAARPWRPDFIPNGNTNGCLNCHVSQFGGDARNAFGLQVQALLPTLGENFWGPGLAGMDADGDGYTNGQELQDPTGAWRPGQPNPGNANLVSLPGSGSSTPPPTPTPTRTPTPTPTATFTEAPTPTPTPSPTPRLPDYNNDGAVDGLDLLRLLEVWGAGDSAVDLDGDGRVDYRDLLRFAAYWEIGVSA